jgi:hypothetical protein
MKTSGPAIVGDKSSGSGDAFGLATLDIALSETRLVAGTPDCEHDHIFSGAEIVHKNAF